MHANGDSLRKIPPPDQVRVELDTMSESTSLIFQMVEALDDEPIVTVVI